MPSGRGASGIDGAEGRTAGLSEGIGIDDAIERTISTVERLKRRADFLAAAAGRRFHTERMTAQGMLRAGTGPQGLRVGLTVTKRVGHATERNRIKRRLRSVVALVAPDLPCLAADIVLVARRPTLHAPFDQLAQDIRRAVHAVTKPRTDEKAGQFRSRNDAKPRRGAKSDRPSRPGSGAVGPVPTHEGGTGDPACPPAPLLPRQPA